VIRLAVTGAAGRMGGRIIDLASADERFRVVAALEAAGHPRLGEAACEGVKIADRLDADFDVLVDFSLPDSSVKWLEEVHRAGKRIVIGTTGHDEGQLARIREAARSIAVLKAANMSVGINLLLRLVGRVGQVLGADYDIEIAEVHHRFKKDAPSGTALALLEAICRALGKSPADVVVHGRQGREAARRPGEIGVHALRLGDTVGQHEVFFSTLGETISLKHVAHTRDTFASGALRAALWIHDKPPGLYSMQDVLFGEAG